MKTSFHPSNWFSFAAAVLSVGLFALCGSPLVSAVTSAPANSSTSTASTDSCGDQTWENSLFKFLDPNTPLPTDDTANPDAPDCAFHQWSWEAFVWATALDRNGVPRFMTLHTPDELLDPNPKTAPAPRHLKLALRANARHGTSGYVEGAGAIVEADGNMLVGQNGYPVYASVHMNQAYFDKARQNLVVTGAFDANTPSDDYFELGAAVFKATWMRLDRETDAPAGAFVTEADVPVLTSEVIDGFTVIHPVIPQKTVTVKVALVGLHVVGFTQNHPEFLWGTFEHVDNAPMLPDNTFPIEPTLLKTTSYPQSFTFYAKGTTYDLVNLPNQNPGTTPVLDVATQRLSPVTNVVQENATGGETFSTNGAAHIAALNTAGQHFLSTVKSPLQAKFSHYRLIGTVWLAPNSYNNASQAANASAPNGLGSVNLANSTAETFQQIPRTTPTKNVQNCFLCHNATSYSFQAIPHASRRIAISHVLSQGLPYYGVPNQIPATPLISGLK